MGLTKYKLLNKLKPKGIGFNAFKEFKESISETPTDTETVTNIILKFYPQDKRTVQTCVTEFNNKITRKVKYWLPKDLNFEDKAASFLIIADMFFTRTDYVGLYNHLFKDNQTDISVQLAEQVAKLFISSTKDLAERYEWIFNPPATPSKKKGATIGDEYRSEFSQKYGPYSEIMYLISGGDPLKNEEIERMRCDKFLSIGEYLNHKRIVENIE